MVTQSPERMSQPIQKVLIFQCTYLFCKFFSILAKMPGFLIPSTHVWRLTAQLNRLLHPLCNLAQKIFCVPSWTLAEVKDVCSWDKYIQKFLLYLRKLHGECAYSKMFFTETIIFQDFIFHFPVYLPQQALVRQLPLHIAI